MFRRGSCGCRPFNFRVVDNREVMAHSGTRAVPVRGRPRDHFWCFPKPVLQVSQTTTRVTCGFSRLCSQAAHVPSSKVTCELPRRPRRNCRIVSPLLSRLASITKLPAESKTAAEIVAWCTSVYCRTPGR